MTINLMSYLREAFQTCSLNLRTVLHQATKMYLLPEVESQDLLKDGSTS